MQYGVSAHARESPERTALIHGDLRLSYAELERRSDRLAHVLRDRGVQAGDHVATLLPNGVEFFETALATAKLRACFAPLNWHTSVAELQDILADPSIRLVVAHTDHGNLPRQAGVLVTTGDEGGDYEASIASVPDSAGPIVGWGSPQYVHYTSGTTGRPKAIVRTVDGERLHQNRIRIVEMWGFRSDDVHILSGPSYHGGCGGFALNNLFAGATVVILPEWDARRWLLLVERHRVTTAFMNPAHFIGILQVPDTERRARDVSSLRLIIHSGAPCPVAVKRRIIEALAPGEVWELYGMSEGFSMRVSPADWLLRPGTAGRPDPGTSVRILDGEGNELPPGATGLIYFVPLEINRFRYHGDAEKTAAAWRGDAFTAGDIGHLDEDGYLFVSDRAADAVVVDGTQVFPRQVEEVLHEHPGVLDCAVFGVVAGDGEALVATVQARSGVDAKSLHAHCQARLQAGSCPSVIELVDEVPRDPNGKVLKRLLRDRWLEVSKGGA